MSAMEGIVSTTLRKRRSVMTSRSTADVVVAVAVRGLSVISAISPSQSPGPRSAIFFPFFVTRAVPSMRTKNSRPGLPSRVRTVPSRTSSSSAVLASSRNSLFEHPAKSGTFFRSSTFASRRSGTASS